MVDLGGRMCGVRPHIRATFDAIPLELDVEVDSHRVIRVGCVGTEKEPAEELASWADQDADSEDLEGHRSSSQHQYNWASHPSQEGTATWAAAS